MDSSKYRVLMVCTGNICRSTMAQQVLDEALQEALPGLVHVDSAGTSDEERGRMLDPRAARALEECGYAIPDHRARQVTADDLRNTDLVLAMTRQHESALMRLADQHGRRVTQRGATVSPTATDVGNGLCDVRLFRSFDPQATPGQVDVADPWYGGYNDFLDTLDLIERTTPHIVEHIRSRVHVPRGSGAA